MQTSTSPLTTLPLDPWCIRETTFDTASHFLPEHLKCLHKREIFYARICKLAEHDKEDQSDRIIKHGFTRDDRFQARRYF